MSESKGQSNSYILSDSSAQKEYIELRSVEKWIPFLLPYLKPGLNVLDCGCGVGSISLDIAERVYPGKVCGIDLDDYQLEIGRKNAFERDIDNITFEKSDIYSMPFKKDSFDIVLAHTLLIHLNNQLEALKCFYNIFKPGGIVAVSDDDWGTAVQTPESPVTGKSMELMAKVIKYKGGNPFYSRNLRSLMLQAGFVRNEGFALAPEYYGTLEETRRIVSVVNKILRSSEFTELVTQKCWVTKDELDNIVEENILWAEAPDSFAAHMYCAALGWKPE